MVSTAHSLWLVHAVVFSLNALRPALTSHCRKLSASLCEVVEDFNLVSFFPLAIEVSEKLATHNCKKALLAMHAYMATNLPSHPPLFDMLCCTHAVTELIDIHVNWSPGILIITINLN